MLSPNDKNSKFKILILLSSVFTSYLLLFTFSSAQENTSQKILDLRQQIQELEKQSAEYKSQIQQKQQESGTLKRELAILESQIAKLRVNILATNGKIKLTGLEIQDLNVEIIKTEAKINKNKESISELLRRLNSLEKQDLAMVILANPRISDFFNHLQYLNNLQDQLIANLNIFIGLKDELEDRKEETENKKQQLETLNKKQQNQKAAYEGNQAVKDDLFAKTKGQEKKFQELLNEVERKKSEFYRELQNLEAEARKQELYIVRVKASIPPRGNKLFKMPEDDYIITQGYGMTSFAKKGVYGGAPHNGIDMTSGYGSEIRSIGPGTVLAKGFNNAAGNWVAVRHDNDLVSVYGHMRDSSLALVGERADENTVIGFEGATGFVTGSHLHLSLYYEFFTFIGPKTGQIYFNYFQGSLNPLDYI